MKNENFRIWSQIVSCFLYRILRNRWDAYMKLLSPISCDMVIILQFISNMVTYVSENDTMEKIIFPFDQVFPIDADVSWI